MNHFKEEFIKFYKDSFYQISKKDFDFDSVYKKLSEKEYYSPFIEEFLLQFKPIFKPSNHLIIKGSEHFISFPNRYDELNKESTLLNIYNTKNTLDELEALGDEKYDFITGDFPVTGKRSKVFYDKKQYTLPMHLKLIYNSCKYLSDNGIGLYIINPIMWTEQWKRFTKIMKDSGFYISAIFNTPPAPLSSIQFVIIFITKYSDKKVFVAEIPDANSFSTVFKNYLNKTTTDDISSGVYININEFKGFVHYWNKLEIDNLESNYKNYKQYKIVDVAKEINIISIDKGYDEKPNSIYLPKVGASRVVTDIKASNLRAKNFFQIVLDKKLVLNEYAANFYTTGLGKKIINSIRSGATIPNVTKNDLDDALIAVPSINDQKSINEAYKKIATLNHEVDNISDELSLNPQNAVSVQDKIDDMLKDLSVYTEVDDLKRTIRRGESKYTEFKETIIFDVKIGGKSKIIQFEIVKSIAGFLNTEGGKLIVGVADNGAIKGVNEEMKKFYPTKDDYLLRLSDIINKNIGMRFTGLINYDLKRVDDLDLLVVNIDKSESECFIGDDFYVRMSPATIKLDGKELVKYVETRFKTSK